MVGVAFAGLIGRFCTVGWHPGCRRRRSCRGVGGRWVGLATAPSAGPKGPSPAPWGTLAFPVGARAWSVRLFSRWSRLGLLRPAHWLPGAPRGENNAAVGASGRVWGCRVVCAMPCSLFRCPGARLLAPLARRSFSGRGVGACPPRRPSARARVRSQDVGEARRALPVRVPSKPSNGL